MDFESNGYSGTWLPGRRVNGEHGIAIIVKRRFDVDLASARCVPAPEQPPVVMSPVLGEAEDPSLAELIEPGEIAVEKARVDVLVRATAYAPKGEPAAEFEVGLKIAGALNRRLRIIGDRSVSFVPPKKWLSYKDLAAGLKQEYPTPEISEPRPLAKLPLTYAFAYGGQAKLVIDDEVAELAAEAQEEAKLEDERRERKKEIEAELIAEEEAKAEDARKAKEVKAGGVGGIEDEETRDRAAAAFSEGTQQVDEETLARLAAEDESETMKVVSAFGLGDLKDGSGGGDAEDASAEGADPESDAAEGEGAGDSEDTGDSEESSADDPLAGFFSGGEQKLEPGAAPIQDELKELLDERAKRDARKLRDERSGALISKATEHGDIALSDDDWIATHGERPAERRSSKPASEHPLMPYPANPAGRGFCVSPSDAGVDGMLLPNIEDPDEPLDPDELYVDMTELDLRKLAAPAGWAAYPMGWYPRAGLAGCYSWDMEAAEAGLAKVLEDYDPEDPGDAATIAALEGLEIPLMRVGFFQDAHPKMQVERVNGDEEVMMTNLTPEGTLFFRLPGLHPRTTFDTGRGAEPIGMRLDTLTFDVTEPGAPFVQLLWRGWYPLPKGYEEMAGFTRYDVVVDEVDQVDWFDLLRDQERDAKKAKRRRDDAERKVSAFELAEETEADAEEAAISGAEAERRFREELAGRGSRGASGDGAATGAGGDGDVDGAGDGIGALRGDDGAEVWEADEQRKLSDDAWAQRIRDEKEGFHEDAAAKDAAAKKAKLKELRKKAREQADEEMGIEWEDED